MSSSWPGDPWRRETAFIRSDAHHVGIISFSHISMHVLIFYGPTSRLLFLIWYIFTLDICIWGFFGGNGIHASFFFQLLVYAFRWINLDLVNSHCFYVQAGCWFRCDYRNPPEKVRYENTSVYTFKHWVCHSLSN